MFILNWLTINVLLNNFSSIQSSINGGHSGSPRLLDDLLFFPLLEEQQHRSVCSSIDEPETGISEKAMNSHPNIRFLYPLLLSEVHISSILMNTHEILKNISSRLTDKSCSNIIRQDNVVCNGFLLKY